jgi:undecaprenyl phosphate N,N'-diacetylbacillosamine 1-phosphate transferase
MSRLYTLFIKRLIDIFLSLVLFLLLSPLFVVVTLLLAVADGGKPFFRQQRPGLHGRLFTILKYKTMNDRRNAQGQLLPDEQRLTSIGRLVRRTSLDEIPQLLNVIRGDMSLVGPRPLLEEYLPLYSEVQRRRHEVRPGITGWAQVNGRNTVGWEEKFGYDVWYVDHCSFSLDCRILGMTIRKVFRSEGISSNTSATMEKFSKTI